MRAVMQVTAILLLLMGFNNAALASAKSDWNALPKPIYKCMKKMVEAANKALLCKATVVDRLIVDADRYANYYL